MLALWVGCAFVLGLAVRPFGLPPLVGFLAAGFVLNALGAEAGPALDEVAHVGVLLLLFTVGLKLRLQNLLRPEVWATGLLHMAITAAVLGGALHLVFGFDWPTAAMLALALGFSSTVVAAKVLEEKRELRSFHGRVAIGVLIIQDLVAVALLAGSGGHAPSPFAIALFALPVVRPFLHWMLDVSGHGEMLVLYGALLALAVGGFGFEYLGLSSELGALVLGSMLAGHPRANEVSNALWGLKEFFLVGFFLSIGFSGLPTMDGFLFALLMVAILPLKAVLFFGIMLMFRLRARSSFLGALALATYSEFGLIVTQLAVRNGWLGQEWLVYLALAVALSFVAAAPFNRMAHGLYERLQSFLQPLERNERHPDDEPIALGSATIAIIGMGRVGTGAYDQLRSRGFAVVGLDSDPAKVQRHRAEGRKVLYADAEDPGFWQRLRLDGVEGIMFAIPDVPAKISACTQLRRNGYRGLLSATHVYPEEQAPILAAGCDVSYNYFQEAGVGFATHTARTLRPGSDDPVA